jgi:hypothetical protein
MRRPTGTIIEAPEAVGEAAEHGGAGEDRDRAGEDGAGAEPLRRPAAEGNAGRQHDHVAGDAEVEVDRVDVKAQRHPRDGGGDHGAVQQLHEGAGSGEQRDQDR